MIYYLYFDSLYSVHAAIAVSSQGDVQVLVKFRSRTVSIGGSGTAIVLEFFMCHLLQKMPSEMLLHLVLNRSILRSYVGFAGVVPNMYRNS